MKKVEIKQQQFKAGLRLAKQVNTSLDGPLFEQGHLLSKEDVLVLRAFLIPKITVELVEDTSIEEIISIEKNTHRVGQSFFDQYSMLLQKADQLYKQIIKKDQAALLQIKQNLYPFIEQGLTQPLSIFVDLPRINQTDGYLYHHSLCVSLFVALLANKAGMNKKQILESALAGYLHNIGQLKISEFILSKPGALTEEEFAEIQKHPSYSYMILKEIPQISPEILNSVLQHHEREDGSGYPLGLTGEKIHDYAKMIAIVDIYVAMCSEKVYQRAYSPYVVVEQLKNDSFGKLNPTYVLYFLELVSSTLTLGKKVELSNGWTGDIVYLDPNALTRPMVNCNGQIVNLQREKELYIEDVV